MTSLNTLFYRFESSVYKTEEYAEFERKYRSWMRRVCKNIRKESVRQYVLSLLQRRKRLPRRKQLLMQTRSVGRAIAEKIKLN